MKRITATIRRAMAYMAAMHQESHLAHARDSVAQAEEALREARQYAAKVRAKYAPPLGGHAAPATEPPPEFVVVLGYNTDTHAWERCWSYACPRTGVLRWVSHEDGGRMNVSQWAPIPQHQPDGLTNYAMAA